MNFVLTPGTRISLAGLEGVITDISLGNKMQTVDFGLFSAVLDLTMFPDLKIL